MHSLLKTRNDLAQAGVIRRNLPSLSTKDPCHCVSLWSNCPCWDILKCRAQDPVSAYSDQAKSALGHHNPVSELDDLSGPSKLGQSIPHPVSSSSKCEKHDAVKAHSFSDT